MRMTMSNSKIDLPIKGLRVAHLNVRTGKLTLWNPAALTKDKCRHFAKYKGLRAPSCGCRACFDLYITNVKEKGDKVGEVDFPGEQVA